MDLLEKNKAIVTRFNMEYLSGGDLAVYRELVSDAVINHIAPAGTPNGYDGMLYFLENILRKGFPDMQVDILDMIAEGDRVTTRKRIRATHLGPIMGIAATGLSVDIDVIDIIRLKDGKYTDHWGNSTIMEVIGELRKAAATASPPSTGTTGA